MKSLSKSWKIAFVVVICLAAVFAAYFLRAIFLPLLVALLLAYILNPILTSLEKRGVPRMLSIAAVYLLLAGIVAGLVFWAIPKGFAEGRQFVHETFTADNPKIQRVGEKVKGWLGAENWNDAVRIVREKMKGHQDQLTRIGGSVVGEVVSFMMTSVASFIAVFSFVALIPVYLFFLLKNMNPWWERFKHWIPRQYRVQTLGTLDKIHRANASFFRGQITISLIEGFLIFLGLTFMKVKFALLFGALYTILSIVPFLGVAIGFTVTAIFVLADTGEFGTKFFLVAGLFAAIQALEAAVLQPLILGKETGLHPIVIILALLICGELLGFFGMLIAIPIASTVKIVFDDYVKPIFEEVADLTRVRPRPEGDPTPTPAPAPSQGDRAP